ncbi:hypothetical protein [uncultured Victivallis sp.]|uniref:Flp family type IVb pilin n=1 Tax=Victivallis sp. TaxID=2049020 RepID=UPI0025D9B037|nr:hypothetical protein [uncultured Victivallis sp.]
MGVIRNRKRRGQRGQAVVEYIILVVVIALGALFVLANFSDRLRDMITGVTVTLGGEEDATADRSSLDIVQELDKTGVD